MVTYFSFIVVLLMFVYIIYTTATFKKKLEETRKTKTYMISIMIGLCVILTFAYAFINNSLSNSTVWAFNTALWGFNLYITQK